jgi:hypothetical protein
MGQDEINRMLEQWSHENHGSVGGGGRLRNNSATPATAPTTGGAPQQVAPAAADKSSDMANLPHQDHTTWLMPGKMKRKQYTAESDYYFCLFLY